MCPVPRLVGHALLLCLVIGGGVAAAPTYVTDPGSPGPDLPPAGRSLFDRLTIADGRQQIPFPFDALVRHLASGLDSGQAYLGRAVKSVLIPHGRSLQRAAAAPDFFASPRIVAAFDASPIAESADWPGNLLQDRLYIAYMPVADVLEVISYNPTLGRFEFQLVSDYREGGQARDRKSVV